MPRSKDLDSVMIIGSGPIVIGQACEFDYSGTQACKALREEGIRVVLLNSNPATIMTDPEMADRTYVEPITPEAIDKILSLERARGTPIDAILPTLGGQTGLNCAAKAADAGILDKHRVALIGATRAAIHKAENRTEFKNAMLRIGLDLPRSGIAHTWEECRAIVKDIGLPCVIRPAYTLGGTGGGFAYTPEEYETICKRGLEYSLNSEVLIEESCLGWKEYELEVMRDRADNVVIICSIENFDPMGVHTGDSITVAPAQTLTDKEYQRMRDAAIAIIREIGVDTGGSNIQFAVHPGTGRMIVIEMNPRVSRSSALASKATGYPIAKIAAKLAIGYTLDEIPNDITRKTPASFEPTIDYVVTKIPRWAFEKFPEADETLTTQMKSVGEAMSIGRTFKESLQKGIRSMEIKRFGLGLDANDAWLTAMRKAEESKVEIQKKQGQGSGQTTDDDDATIRGWREGEPPADTQEKRAGDWPITADVLRDKLRRPCQGRLYYIRYAYKMGWTTDQIFELSKIDPWFLDNIKELVEFEQELLNAARNAREAGPCLDWAHEVMAWCDGVRTTGEATDAFPERPDGLGETCERLAEGVIHAKRWGYSNVQLATALGVSPDRVRSFCRWCGAQPVYKLVDTCAAEFEAYTPYYYSSTENPPGTRELFGITKDLPPDVEIRLTGSGGGSVVLPRELMAVCGTDSIPTPDDEIRVTEKFKVVILGGGPNRIGQGIEFDYCCVHAVMAARKLGYETVMINSNPETVSTDYDTSDLLFFEPLTHEDVLNICERLNGRPLCPGRATRVSCGEGLEPDSSGGLLKGVVVQFGGQTPLNLAMGLKRAGVPILGTTPESIHLAEDREAFARVLNELGLRQPPNGIAFNLEGAVGIAREIGYPVLVRPSYVLGGRGMQKCHLEADLVHYMEDALQATDRSATVDEKHPVLIDHFLTEAIEVDVDCISDGKDAVVCGVMEHIEEAGIHSGDSACALPPYSLPPSHVDELRSQTVALALKLGVRGLMNIQFAIKDDVIYVLEVNPRASRTVPFVSKATGVPWAKLATEVMLGKSLVEAMNERGLADAPWPRHISVKEAVFPFNKFPGVDCILGPEMRSTGEVMGVDFSFGLAFAKAQMAAGSPLPTKGTVLISVNDHDKPLIVAIAREFAEMGFRIISTKRTREELVKWGIRAELVYKVQDAQGPYLIDMINAGEVDLLINTPIFWGSAATEARIRSAAVMHNIPLVTTMAGARAAMHAIRALRQGDWTVRALQDYCPT
ncbi:MAG TPA: carbamoyl-phosphate synthase large subunit [Phycisphaerae bacterium]|nr:carbamoyl-phosphate synthase large subunit [Phycisphaerae bacterium]HRY67379.1 carbamoyl-phosphate synthase large subunit [Phycisphaerae bacterium]HSA29329.1 carbamoyl-phosphate synthase large subunit [Phycisphaerae bacterium]